MGRNVEDERLGEAEPAEALELAAAACGLVLPPPLEAGAGGAPPVTALMIPLRIVCARLGCGGGAADEAVAAGLAVPVAAAPAPVPTEGLTPDDAPAPAAKPLTPDTSAPAATAPARTIESAVDPTSPEISFFAINGIKPRASA